MTFLILDFASLVVGVWIIEVVVSYILGKSIDKDDDEEHKDY